MRAMRARGFNGYGDLELVNLPKPQVPNGKVLVRMTAAGVTPLDHTILSGQYPKAKAPLILGNEGAGVDHFFGLKLLLDRFPNAGAFATASAVAAIVFCTPARPA